MPAGRKVKKKAALPRDKKPKKRAAAVAARRKRAAKPKTAARKPPSKPKKKATAKKRAARVPPPPRPSQRAIEAVTELPHERALTDEERDAMANVAALAKKFLGTDGTPSEVARRIAGFVDEIRGGQAMPKSNDVRLGLGALWGEQVRAQVGWRWVHLTYEDLAFSSYALVPDDRAFACFPLNRIPDLMNGGVNTSLVLFEKIRVGDLPRRKPNAYLVIG